MIPKIIHYCWFGRKPLPDEVKKNIKSWEKFCPGYQIKEWNEDNFDVTSNIYVQEAYESCKWAFVTDYVRLFAMVTEGGIYMDTDVEVLRPLDEFLHHHAFSGFETDTDIPTGIMASEKGFPLFQKLLQDYNNRHFILPDGQFDLTSNVYTITQACLPYGLIQNNQFQILNGFAIYPKDFFCPKDHRTGIISCTSNTVTIHHFSGSWVTGKSRKWMELEKRIRRRGNKYINSFLDTKFWDILKKLYIRDLSTNIKKIKEKLSK